jgi:hypothetical protein
MPLPHTGAVLTAQGARVVDVVRAKLVPLTVTSAKSTELLLRSAQPALLRRRTLPAIGAGAGPEPSKESTVVVVP